MHQVWPRRCDAGRVGGRRRHHVARVHVATIAATARRTRAFRGAKACPPPERPPPARRCRHARTQQHRQRGKHVGLCSSEAGADVGCREVGLRRGALPQRACGRHSRRQQRVRCGHSTWGDVAWRLICVPGLTGLQAVIAAARDDTVPLRSGVNVADCGYSQQRGCCGQDAAAVLTARCGLRVRRGRRECVRADDSVGQAAVDEAGHACVAVAEHRKGAREWQSAQLRGVGRGTLSHDYILKVVVCVCRLADLDVYTPSTWPVVRAPG